MGEVQQIISDRSLWGLEGQIWASVCGSRGVSVCVRVSECVCVCGCVCALKQTTRKLEKKWCSTKLEVFHLAWKDSLLSYKRVLSEAKSAYYSSLIDNNKNNPKFLFNTISRLTKNHNTIEHSV